MPYRIGMASTNLAVRLLGPPEILVDGTPIRVDTRKATAILAYLVATDQPQAREHLAALLWPEADDASARGALRRTLSTLRTALGGRWLIVDRASVRLDGDGAWADVWELRREGRPDEHPDRLLSLLRGEFMAGFGLRDAPEYDDWVLAQADAWRQRAISALDAASRNRSASGDLPAAIEAASRRLELDRLDEEGHRQLMELRARAGDRAGAVRQYRSLVRLLADELSVDPLPETTAAYEAILAGEGIGRVPQPPAAVAAARERLPLVGRAAELAALRDAAGAEGVRVVLIEGEAGIGKTRLAEELVAMVEGAGRRWLELRGYPGRQDAPYAPLVEVLERLAADDDPRLAILAPSVREEISRLVPRLAQVGGRPGLNEGPAARARFVGALAGALSSLAGDVLLVDDSQAMDPASLGVIAEVARRSSSEGLVVSILRRPVDPADDPLLPMLSDARRRGLLREIRPGRLTRGDVRELVERTGAARPADADALHGESGGVPFYLAERLAAMAAGAEPGAITSGIRDLVRTRALACGDVARQLLSAAAVIGGSFDLGLLRAVSGRSEAEATLAVDELLTHGLLVAAGARLEIDHELTRSVVLDDLGVGRRRTLHRRAATAISRRGGRRHAPAEVARHLENAGATEEASEWYRLAGERASELYAHHEAVEYYRAAQALNPDVDGGLHERIAEGLMSLGRYRDAVSAYEAAAGGVPAADSWRADLGLARANRRLGSLPLARAYVESALLSLGADRAGERSAVLMERARIEDRLGRLDEAMASANEALSLVREHGTAAELAQAHNLCGLIARHRGDLPASREHLAEALAQAASLPAPSARMAALNNLALLQAAHGDTDDAEARLRQALSIAVATGDRHHEAALRNNLADVLNAAGRRRDAVGEVARSAAILAELGGVGIAGEDPTTEVWRLVDW
jgi:DNA-binding SARP family transcriptional activator/predicted ATPase